VSQALANPREPVDQQVGPKDSAGTVTPTPILSTQSLSELPGQINLLVTEGTGPEIIPIGLLEGKWTGRKEFEVSKVSIKGKLPRSRVLEIAGRFNLRDAVQQYLLKSRRDDPVILNLLCYVDLDRAPRVDTRVPGGDQNLDLSLIPAVDMLNSKVDIGVDENSVPLELRVRAGSPEV
jgi:hypothetical protein